MEICRNDDEEEGDKDHPLTIGFMEREEVKNNDCSDKKR